MIARIRRLKECFIQVKGQNENGTSQTKQIAFMIKRQVTKIPGLMNPTAFILKEFAPAFTGNS